jgi:DNA invertase Pin-like site-specific DNA recombinase
MFQIIGAMAEFDRALIQERVRSGLRNAKLKGAVLGSPRRVLDGNEALRLRAEGLSFREIARILGASPETVRTRLGAVTKKR